MTKISAPKASRRRSNACAQIRAADALLVVTPEYYSIPGVLKNAAKLLAALADWTPQLKPRS